MKILTKIKQLFCKHQWKYYLEYPFYRLVFECQKCEKERQEQYGNPFLIYNKKEKATLKNKCISEIETTQKAGDKP